MTATGTHPGLAALLNPTEAGVEVNDDVGEQGEGIFSNPGLLPTNIPGRYIVQQGGLPGEIAPNVPVAQFQAGRAPRQAQRAIGPLGIADFLLNPGLLPTSIPGRYIVQQGGLPGEIALNIPAAQFQPGRVSRQVQVPIGALEFGDFPLNEQILQENRLLRREIRRLQEALQNSKLENADLYSKFGDLAKDWAETVKNLNALHEEQRKEYEDRIGHLEKTNEKLIKENEEMKKVIKDLNKMKLEFERQKRKLRLGQIAFQLDKLVSEYVFPGDDKASKRARYGTKLKSVKEKIEKMKDKYIQEAARRRVYELDEEMFEEWFVGMVDDMKEARVDTAHPKLGSYEEMVKVINEEFKDDDDKREDMLTVLDRLKSMYQLLQRRFGE